MTREEAIKIFNTVLLFGKCDCPKEEIEECLRMAIKALEQEPCENATLKDIFCMGCEYKEQEPKTDVLDKIRAEIEERMRNSGGEPNRELAFNVCLQIIDKYKAGSEDENADSN